jgi:2-phosphosulfolactate phosphatase
MTSLEVTVTPADFSALRQRDLSEAFCVVFDVLRATSTMITALANGAEGIIPVEDIPEALSVRQRKPDVLLAGERNGVRIEASLTGSISFDFGNSPREFIRPTVQNRTVVMTTTNGTRALRACAGARCVLACSFLNLGATVDFVRRENPSELLVICSGTHEEAAYEDVLGAGAFCDRVWSGYARGQIADSALMARTLYLLAQKDLVGAMSNSRNGARLLTISELREDVAFCARRDTVELVAELGKEGTLRRR